MQLEPRSGLLGAWDKIVGPGASATETVVTLTAMTASVPLAWYAVVRDGSPHWQWWTWIIVLVLASDLGGGLVSNALPATKRWYHRPGSTAMQHLGFAALHVHPFALAWLAPDQVNWTWALLLYLWMLVSCGVLLLVPRPVRLAIAFALTATGVVVSSRWVPVASPLGWVSCVLLLKVLAGHMVGPEAVSD
jgi:hypothetical protein